MANRRNQLRDEVTGLLLRGGLIGLVIFAVSIAFMVVPRQLGRIEPLITAQTGFRGLGMNQPEFVEDVAEQIVLNTLPDPFMGGPIPPEPGEPLAGDIYENVQVLGHLTDANFNRLMVAITEWVSPEQGCAYCHGDEGNFASDEYYPKVVARNMIAMTWAINGDWNAHVQETGVTCYTCHRGNNVPQQVWFLPEPHSRFAGRYAAYQNLAVPAVAGSGAVPNYSTALPRDALTAFLLEDSRQVAVHGYEPRDAEGISNASIYETYQTYSLMMHFSSGLGVNCTYCHNTRAPQQVDQATPQWATAQIGRQMVIDVNNSHILPTEPLLPPFRLGPLGDVAKVNCTTCHQGAALPLLGQSMLADWPELVSPEPVYE